MLGIDAQTPYLLGGQQLVAVVSAEHPQLGTILTPGHQQPFLVADPAPSSCPDPGWPWPVGSAEAGRTTLPKPGAAAHRWTGPMGILDESRKEYVGAVMSIDVSHQRHHIGEITIR